MSAPSKHYTEYAFARPSVEITDNPRDYGQAGMTIRDYFAAQALTGMLANPGVDCSNGTLARSAYSIADAMLKQREAQP